jgi:DNA repair exonuclease SbcCD ATPase subunit
MSRATVCPGLYKDERGKFYCRYAGDAEIDPAFMPCLLEYWECSFYIKHRRAEKAEEEEKKKETPKPEEVRAVEEVKTVAPAFVAPPTETRVESFGYDIDSLIERAGELAKLWENYEEEARRVVEEWEELGEKIRKELAGLEASINAYIEELDRVEKLFESGRISEEEFSDLRSRIESKLAEKNSEREALARKLAELDRVVLPHYKRVKVAEVKPEIAKLRLALSKLEERFKSGSISEEVYKRLRTELEDKIQRLEKIREEVE